MTALIVLSSGGPVPNADSFGTSYVVKTGGRNFLFDCGPATTAKLAKLGLSSLDFDQLFISHHHFDHTADLPAFLLTRWDHSVGKENRLQIFGPEPTVEMIERLIGPRGAFAFDWSARVNHPLSQQMHSLRGGDLPRPHPEHDVQNVTTGVIFDSNEVKVTAQRVEHVQPHLESNAYRIDSPEISIVFTGDARPCEHLVELATGADVLVTMCGNFQSELIRKGVEAGQIGSVAAGELAAESGVGHLVLAHMGPEISSKDGRIRAEQEIREIYNGKITISDEMSTYPLTHSIYDPHVDVGVHPHIVRDITRSSSK